MRLMRLDREILTKLLSEAFDLGQDSSYELREQTIEDLIFNLERGQEDPWVTLSLKELNSLPSGRKVFHSSFGEGVVTIKNSERYVQFAGFRMEMAEEGWPWTEKMQVIS